MLTLEDGELHTIPIYSVGREMANWTMTGFAAGMDTSGVRVLPGLSLGNAVSVPALSIVNFAEHYQANTMLGRPHAVRRAFVETLVDVPELFLPPGPSLFMLGSRIAHATAEPYRSVIVDMPGDVSDEIERWESYGFLRIFGWPSSMLDRAKSATADTVNDMLDREAERGRPVYGDIQRAGFTLPGGQESLLDHSYTPIPVSWGTERVRGYTFQIPSRCQMLPPEFNINPPISFNAESGMFVSDDHVDHSVQRISGSDITYATPQQMGIHFRSEGRPESLSDRVTIAVSGGANGVSVAIGIKLGLSWASLGLGVAVMGAFYGVMRYQQHREERKFKAKVKKVKAFSSKDKRFTEELSRMSQEVAGKEITLEEETEYYRRVQEVTGQAAENLTKEYKYVKHRKKKLYGKKESEWKEFKHGIKGKIAEYEQMAQQAAQDRQATQFLADASLADLGHAIQVGSISSGFVIKAKVLYHQQFLNKMMGLFESSDQINYPQIITLCDDAVTTLGEQPEVLTFRAIAYHETGQIESAVRDAEIAYEANLKNFHAFLVLLDGCLRQKDFTRLTQIAHRGLESFGEPEKQALIFTYLEQATEQQVAVDREAIFVLTHGVQSLFSAQRVLRDEVLVLSYEVGEEAQGPSVELGSM